MPDHDHPLRYALVNELHARPFPELTVPSTAVFLAIKDPVAAANEELGAGAGLDALVRAALKKAAK